MESVFLSSGVAGGDGLVRRSGLSGCVYTGSCVELLHTEEKNVIKERWKC